MTRFSPALIGRLLVPVLLMSAAPSRADEASAPYVDITDRPITLRVRDVPDPHDRSAGGRAKYALIQEFQRRYPSITIERATGLRLYAEMEESADYMAMAGGMAADVLDLHLRKFPNFLEEDFVSPLDEFIEYEDSLRGPDEDDFISYLDVPDQLWPVVYRNGHYYGIIYSHYVMGLIYRKDLLREAGLPPRAPRDWDELMYFAQKATYPEKKIAKSLVATGQYGMGLYRSRYSGWYWTDFVWQAGGDMVHQYWKCPVDGWEWEAAKEEPLPTCPNDGTHADPRQIKWKVVFDSPEAVTALNYWKALRWNEWTRCPACDEPVDVTVYDWRNNADKTRGTHLYTDPDTGEVDPDYRVCPECGEVIEVRAARRANKVITGVCHFDNAGLLTQKCLTGEVAMFLGVPDQQLFQDFQSNGLGRDKVGFASLPVGPAKIHGNFIGGLVYSINSTQRDPYVRKAAWEYIKFMCSPEGQRLSTKTYVESGYAGYVMPQLLKKFGYDEYYREIPPEMIETYRDIRIHGRVEPTSPNYQNVQTEQLAVPIDKVLLDADTDAAEVLRACALKVNTFIMGRRPEAEMRRYRRIGFALIAVTGTLIVLLLARALRLLSSQYQLEHAALRRVPARKQLIAWMLMFPALGSVAVWQYFPLLRGSLMAFFNYRILEGLTRDSFIGIDNFITAVLDPGFWQVLLRTAIYVGMSLGLGFFAPIFLALFLSEVPRGKIVYRTLFYLPAVITGSVTMFLWRTLMYDSSRSGVLNQVLLRVQEIVQSLGDFAAAHFVGGAGTWWANFVENMQYAQFGPIGWLSDTRTAMLAVILCGIWAGAGPGSIIYLAALKCVPEALYEAADIDGASIRHKIFHITLPTIKPLIIMNFVGAFIGSFKAMENIFIMTAGGPANSTRVIGIDIWFNAFLYLKMGFATAEAWILGSMLIGFTMYQLRILRQVEFTAAGQR